MNIPEFRPEAWVAEKEWHDVMAAADISAGEVARVECDGRGLFLMRRLMDHVERFSDGGNVVRLILHRA